MNQDYSDLAIADSPTPQKVSTSSKYADLALPADEPVKDEGAQTNATYPVALKTVFLPEKGITVGYNENMPQEVAFKIIKENHLDIPVVAPPAQGDQAGATREAKPGESKPVPVGSMDVKLGEDLAYPVQRVLSATVEKPAFAVTRLALEAANGYYKFGRFLAEDLKLVQELKDQSPNWLDKAVDYYSSPEEHGYFTHPAEMKRAAYDQNNFQRNYLLGIAGRLSETTIDLMAFFAPLIAAEKLAASAPQLAQSSELKQFMDHAVEMAEYGFTTTNGDLSDRTKAALFLTAYGLTGPIANATGATGLNAMGVNLALNTFLNVASYKEAFSKAGGVNPTFLAMIIPQFLTDFAFSWHTRGTPENEYNARLDKYLKGRAKEMGVPKEQIKPAIQAMKTMLDNPEFFGLNPAVEKNLTESEQLLKLEALGKKAKKKEKIVNSLTDQVLGGKTLEKAVGTTEYSSDILRAVKKRVLDRIDEIQKEKGKLRNHLKQLRSTYTKDLANTEQPVTEKPAEPVKPTQTSEVAPPEKSTVQAPAETAAPSTIKSRNPKRESAVLQKVQDKLEDLKINDPITYNTINIAEQSALASKFIEEQPELARKVALGLQGPPKSVLQEAVAIAYAEKMLAEGNNVEWYRATRARAFRQTRRGEEIVMERGQINENSPERFVKEVLKARMAMVGKKFFPDSPKEVEKKVAEKMNGDVKKLKERMVKERLDISEAQKILDSIIC